MVRKFLDIGRVQLELVALHVLILNILKYYISSKKWCHTWGTLTQYLFKLTLPEQGPQPQLFASGVSFNTFSWRSF